jgi:hypothetical protein
MLDPASGSIVLPGSATVTVALRRCRLVRNVFLAADRL